MVSKPNGYEDGLNGVFAALADPTRRAILGELRRGDATETDAAAEGNLKVLEQAGLISRSRQATARLSHLEAAPLREAVGWLMDYRSYWAESFGRLDDVLDELRGES